MAYASGLLNPKIIFFGWVSYTHAEFFGRYGGSLTPKFQAFHLRGLTTPFLLRLTHINYFSFYNLNYKSLLNVVLKTTQPTFTNSDEQPYRAPTPDSTRCHHAHECNDGNSYIQFQWLIHNYISYNSNNHVNTSISMYQHIIFHTHFKPFRFKQIHMDNFGPTSKSGLFLTVPNQYVGCPRTTPPHQASVPLLGTGIHRHFRPHNTQNHFHGFLDKEYPRPLPPGVFRNSTIPVSKRSSCNGDQLCLLSR